MPVFLPGKSHGQRNLADYIVHGVAKSQTHEHTWMDAMCQIQSLKKGTGHAILSNTEQV